MPLSRCLSAVGTTALVLATHAGTAGAHGVEVTADVDGTLATVELTDETGEVCVAVDPPLANGSVAAIVDDTDDVLLILGENFGSGPACQFFDVDIVNGVLDDVDAHRFVIATASNEASGVLRKPPPPESETAISSNPGDDGPNVPLIFGAGIALGVLGLVLRKRRTAR